MYALQEGLDPYASGTVHCTPLLLHGLARVLTRGDTAQLAALLFPTASGSAAPPPPPPPRAVAVFVLADTCAALALALLARALQQRCRATPALPAASRWFPAAAAALYALSPLAVAQCVAMSADALVAAAVLAAVAAAAWGAALPAAALVALAALAALYPAVLVLPLAVLVGCGRSSSRARAALFAGATVACAAVLGALCTALDSRSGSSGARAWVDAVLVFLYRAPDHTPNIGLWWDLLLELFPQFTALFVHVLQLLYFGAYPVAVTLALRRTPLAAVWLLAGSWAVLTPYPSLSHVALHAALCPLVVAAHVHAPRRRAAALRTAAALAVVAAVLAVLLASATRGWLYTGTGNVNFYYAGVLVLQGAQTYWLAATSETVLRDDYVQRHPPLPHEERTAC